MTRTSARLLIFAAVALVALLAASGLASAKSVTITPAGAITATSTRLTFTASGISIICEVRLRGNLRGERRNAEPGVTFGEITGATIRNETCTGGEVGAALFPTREWPMRFSSYNGTFPNSLRSFLFAVERASFLLETFSIFVRCLYEGNARAEQRLIEARRPGVYTTGTETALTEESFIRISGTNCPESRGRMSGTFTLSPTQTMTFTEP